MWVLLSLLAGRAFMSWTPTDQPGFFVIYPALGQLLTLLMMGAVLALDVLAAIWSWRHGRWYEFLGGGFLAGGLIDLVWRPWQVKGIFLSWYGPPICIGGLALIDLWAWT